MEKRFYSNRVGVEIDIYPKPWRYNPFYITGDMYKTKNNENKKNETNLDLSIILFNKKMNLWVRVKDA